MRFKNVIWLYHLKKKSKLQPSAFSRKKALSLSPYVYISEHLKQASLVKTWVKWVST